MNNTEPFVSIFKRGKLRPSTNRRRSISPSASNIQISNDINDQALVQKSQVVLPSKKKSSHLLAAGTKRTATEYDDLYGPEHDGPDVKWTAAGSHQNAAQEIIDGDEAQELLARQEKKRKVSQVEDEESVLDDGLYHGQAGYRKHLQKSKEIPKAMRVGPQRSANTIKTVTIFDYQPDVCKDYKETGYCGFGDTCKFLHDRGTYLAGWQLDKLAAEPKKQAQDASDSESDEDIPFACLICRSPFTDPVVTRCGHYYCSKCAIKRFARNPKCFACGAPTGGIFNRADKVLAKIKNKEADVHNENDQQVNIPSDVKLEGLEEDNEDSEDSDAESG